MDITINGKLVTLRERLTAGDNWDLLTRFSGGSVNFTQMSFEDATDLFRRWIESWEYESDPAQIDSYRDMDLFAEYVPLMQAIAERMTDTFGQAKN